MSTYSKVAKWNERCGNKPAAIGTQAYYDVIEDQLKRIVEELNETIAAVKEKDLVELMDGGLDLDVVVSGLNYLIGGDYDGGISRVLNNNDLKYTKSIKKARSWLTYHEDNGLDCRIHSSIIGSQTYHCVRRLEDGKIMKYGNFPKVDLTDTLPELAVEVVLLVTDEGQLTEEEFEFSEKSGIPIACFGHLSGQDNGDGTVQILEDILNQAEGSAAFVYIVNGSIHSADNFTVEGPSFGQDTDEGEENE